MAVEQRAIETAVSYAVANGYASDDADAIGLVLVGMAIGASLDPSVASQVVQDYLRQFPDAPLYRWARHIGTDT